MAGGRENSGIVVRFSAMQLRERLRRFGGEEGEGVEEVLGVVGVVGVVGVLGVLGVLVVVGAALREATRRFRWRRRSKSVGERTKSLGLLTFDGFIVLRGGRMCDDWNRRGESDDSCVCGGGLRVCVCACD